jgi:hypothetical protein
MFTIVFFCPISDFARILAVCQARAEWMVGIVIDGARHKAKIQAKT